MAKIATVGLGACAILLGILFKGQNVAFLVGLTFAIAASANFPALLMSIMWKKFTTAWRRYEHLLRPGRRRRSPHPEPHRLGRHRPQGRSGQGCGAGEG